MMQQDELKQRIRRSVEAHHRSMLRLAYAYTRNTQDAEDMVQDVFLNYFRLSPVFTSDEHEKAWLLRATINRCKNLLKSSFHRTRSELSDALESNAQPQSDLMDEVLALDEKYRLPIHLYYYEGYALKEIADILGEKPATIGTRLSRGRELIKHAMGGIAHV